MHPARTIPWDELYAGLCEQVAAGNITRKDADFAGLSLFNYSRECQFKGNWNKFTLMSRGLILDVRNRRVAATPFPKFFNIDEVQDLPDLPFQVTEKFDGSLGIVYYVGPFHGVHGWKVATRGSFDSEQAKCAEFWLSVHYAFIEALTPGTTYLVEIIYPGNKIVVDYDNEESLVLLAAYDESGRELTRDELKDVASKFTGFSIVQDWNFGSIEEMLEESKKLGGNREGFVLRYENGLRVKVKGDEYCRLHRLISGITPLRIWELMVAGDDMELIRASLPFELRKDFDKIRVIHQANYYKVIDTAEYWWNALKNETDADCGKFLKTVDNEIARHLVFPCRKMDLLNRASLGGHRCRRMVFNYFRPKGNVLAGYEPTSRMNRVREDTL